MSKLVNMPINQPPLDSMKLPPGLAWALGVDPPIQVIELEGGNNNESAATENASPPPPPPPPRNCSEPAQEEQNKPSSASRRRKQQIRVREESHPKPAKKGKQKLPLYNWSLADPALTPSQREQIKKSTKCKNYRDKNSKLIKNLSEENKQLRSENERLWGENATLRDANETLMSLQVMELFGHDF